MIVSFLNDRVFIMPSTELEQEDILCNYRGIQEEVATCLFGVFGRDNFSKLLDKPIIRNILMNNNTILSIEHPIENFEFVI